MNPMSSTTTSSIRSGSIQGGPSAVNGQLQKISETLPEAARSVTMPDHALSENFQSRLEDGYAINNSMYGSSETRSEGGSFVETRATTESGTPKTPIQKQEASTASTAPTGSSESETRVGRGEIFDQRIKEQEVLRGAADHLIRDVSNKLKANSKELAQRAPMQGLGAAMGFSWQTVAQTNASCVKDLESFSIQLEALSILVKREVDQIKQMPESNDQQELNTRVKKPSGFKALFNFGWITKLKAKSQIAGITRAAKKGELFQLPRKPVEMKEAIEAHLKGILARNMSLTMIKNSGISLNLNDHLTEKA
jgi:hypothetical protein